MMKRNDARANALRFARSVMKDQRVYTEEDMATCESALTALLVHAVDASENIAIDYLAMAIDAARYRWLRERDLETITLGGVFAGLTPDNLVINLDDLDQAIDEAMKREAAE